MFGYVRPVEGELSPAERERYQAVYCGLCHTMGARYGFPARLTLNYDFTLLAMLFLPPEGGPAVCARRCPAHPFRRRAACAPCAGLEAAADESVILAWQKLRDDVADRGFFSGLPARLSARILYPSYRKAARARPEFDRRVTENLARLHELEREKCPSIDRTADAFAGILRSAAPGGLEADRARALEQMLYHLGRWIYLVDAWDDLAEDRKRGRYNPLDARFDGAPEEQADYVRATLTHSTRLAISAFQLEDFGGWTPMIENILYRGMPAVQEAVLTGRWREIKRRRPRGRRETIEGVSPRTREKTDE